MTKSLKTLLNKYFELIKDQFDYGGIKYSFIGKREATDELFDKYGHKWLLGTIDKYTYRYRTVGRERDMLKIGAYMFICWLKRGFHIDNKRIAPIDTTIHHKEIHFPTFVEHIRKNPAEKKRPASILIKFMSFCIENCAKKNWKEINEKELILIFWLSFYIWNERFGHKAGQDTDTWNEDKKNGKKKIRRGNIRGKKY